MALVYLDDIYLIPRACRKTVVYRGFQYGGIGADPPTLSPVIANWVMASVCRGQALERGHVVKMPACTPPCPQDTEVTSDSTPIARKTWGAGVECVA